MSANLGTITYGNLSVVGGYDITASGPGNLIVAGTSMLAGAASMQSDLSVLGHTALQSTFTAAGASTFNASSTFNGLATFASGIVLSSVSDSSSSATGALQVKGGLGVSLSTYLGGILDVTGATTLRSSLSVTGVSTFTGAVRITDTTESLAYTNGALVVDGGAGIAGNLRVGSGSLYLAGHLVLKTDRTTGITYLNSPANQLQINNAGVYHVFVNQNSNANFTVAGAVQINSTGMSVSVNTDSTTTTNGAVTIAGGLGLGMNLTLGGNIKGGIGSSLTIGSGVFNATTQATNTSTGAITTPGGVGIGKDVFIGGNLDVAAGTNVGSFIGNIRLGSAQSGANWIKSGDVARTAGNWTPLRFAPLTSTTSIFSINSTNVTVDTGTVSTSSTTGAFVVTGGTGISGDLFVGSTSTFNGVTNHKADVWFNSSNLYLGNYNDTSAGLVLTANNGPMLFGSTNGSLGTTVNAVKVALTWDQNASVQIKGTTETSSVTTGALTVAGGIGVTKSIYVGTNIFMQSSSFTSGGTDLYINAAGSNVNIRNTAGSVSGEFESSLTDFNFKTNNVTTPTPVAPFVAFNVRKATGIVRVLTTDDASGNQTGAFQVAGGGSVTKNWWVGGNQTILGNLSVAGTISTTGNSPVSFSNTTGSSSPTTGAVVIAGGLGIGQNIHIAGTGNIHDLTTSTSPTTGAFIVAGGTGIGENLNVGGNANVGGNLRVTGNITSTAGTVSFANTTLSTSTTTGAVTIGGGVGIVGNMYLGGIGTVTNTTASTSSSTGALTIAGGIGVAGPSFYGGIQNITNATGSTLPTNGCLITAGGVGIGQNLNVAGNTTVNGSLSVVGNISSTGGTISFTNTVDSTSPTGGAVTIAGGLGVAQSLYVGSTINSTSPTSGGFVLTGGAGIGMNLSVGGNQLMAGTNPLIRFNNSGLGAPTFTTRSVGTKFLLYGSLSETAVEYAIGVENNGLWNSVPTNTATHIFKWYGGQTLAMSLDGRGTMFLPGTDDSTSSTSGTFITNGGAGFAKSIYVGGSMNVTGTTFLNGTVTANTNVTVGGILSTTNSSNSTNSTNGALLSTGGLGVALNANIGQNVGIGGNANITGNVAITGTTMFNNNAESTAITNGSVVMVGGVGIQKSLNVGGALTVGGNTTINGNLYVNGTRTFVDSQVLTTRDNVILTNSAPAGSASGGIAIKRWQTANDFMDGDIVNGDAAEKSGSIQAGSTATTVVLDNGASAVDGYYNGAWIAINAGTGTGQVRRINTYSGSTRTATIYSTADQANLTPTPIEGLDWTTVPDTTSTYQIFTGQYVVSIFDEPNKEFAIGSTSVNPVSDPAVPIRNFIGVHAGSMKLDRYLAVDTINNFTSNAGVNMEGINFKQGVISGVTNINGNLPNVTSTVNLVDNDLNGTITIPGTKQYGSYLILVSDTTSTGASATFLISGSTSRGGSVLRGTTTPGPNSEQLTVSWFIGEYPKLRFSNFPSNGTGATYTYKVTVFAVV